MATLRTCQFGFEAKSTNSTESSAIAISCLAVRAFHGYHLQPELCLEYMMSIAICQEVNDWDRINRKGELVVGK